MSDQTPDPDDLTPPSARQPDGWELFCSGILRAEFGRRPSQAVEKAMAQLAAEEALTTRPKAKPMGWRERIQSQLAGWMTVPVRPALAMGIAVAVIVVMGIYFFAPDLMPYRHLTISPKGCILSDAMNARWGTNSAQPKIGDRLGRGSFYLKSGVVELTFVSLSKVAVEGPATFTVTGDNSMALKTGKISTYVPRRGHGFLVDLPLARVVDLGTRFGAMVDGDQSSEVDIFEGKVEMTPMADSKVTGASAQLTQGMAMLVDNHGAVAATALSEAAFPQPSISLLARPQNCGFDSSTRAAMGGVPVDFGYWSGPAYSLTGPTQGIGTASGPGMLKFLDNSTNPGADSEVWQLVDMRPFKKLLTGGNAEAEFSALFNRIRSDAVVGKKFGLTLAAFHGSAADAKGLWASRKTSALVLVDKEMTADNDPATWEKLNITAALPSGTDFVIVQLRAIASSGDDVQASVFPGNFADLVDLKIRTPLAASSIDTSR